MTKKITHLAIIPDGNRRWAKERGLQVWKGYTESIQKTVDFLKKAFDLEIEYVTFWACSYNNLLERPKEELYILEDVFKRSAKLITEDKDIHNKQVNVNYIGEWQNLLKKDTIETLDKAKEATKNYSNYHLTFLIGYNGDREMLNAINSIDKNTKVTPEILKQNLWTKDLPPVDLIIRTGGEPHLSAGFMMWDAMNTQLYFSDKMWNDFTTDDLIIAIENYNNRQRRFGK
jgi:undecaprenyl diphosphate synthase